MGGVVRLPDDLCNQIAAGEVVERPASVVKELVENSIDAEALRIQIEVGSGGIGLVRITDDGVGMDEHDARLAVERHATSKIAALDDLLSLSTFGFRGEALPSIASVSKFTLRTRRRGVDEGTQVSTDGGTRMEVTPCGMAPGTIVEVRDLFHNVPARRKFLKSVGAESAAISAVVESLALSQPAITFVLTRDGRKARQWLRCASREQRAIANKPADDLQPIRGSRGPLRVEAYLSPPERARAGSTGLTVLINNRVVRDRLLARIIAQAYGSVLDSGRYPVGVAYLDIDSALVDVNVHPQKAEVRFADTRAVQNAIFHVVSEGLAGAFGLAPASRAFTASKQRPAAVPPPRDPPWTRSSRPTSSPRFEPLRGDATPSRPGFERASDPDPWGLSPEPLEAPVPTQPTLGLRPGNMPPANAIPASSESDDLRQDEPANRTATAQGSPAQGSTTHESTTHGSTGYGHLRFLAQVRRMFLLCEGPDGLVIIDQHAAAERVTFARYREAFAKHAVASQRLLVPVPLAIDSEEATFIEEAAGAIEAAGMDLRVVGPTQALVSAVPQLLARADPERLARDLLDEARRVGGRAFSDSVDRAIATMACHGSIRSGDPVSPQEATSLLHALDQVDFGGHCPHGRPLLMQIRYDDLERLVGRR